MNPTSWVGTKNEIARALLDSFEAWLGSRMVADGPERPVTDGDSRELRLRLVGPVGFEPTTCGLKVFQSLALCAPVQGGLTKLENHLIVSRQA